MRTLFLRILLFFWVAMTVIGAAFAVIFFEDESQRPRERWSHLRSLALRQHGLDVARRLDEEGPDAAREAVATFERQTGLRSYLFCDGVPCASTSDPPEDVRRIAERAAGSGGPVQQHDDTTDRHAEPLDPAHPERRIVAGTLARPTPLERFLVPRTLWLRLGVMVLVAGAVGWALARHLSRPIRRLRLAAGRIEQGELGSRVGPDLADRRDEIGALGRDFDRMAERVESLLAAQHQLLLDASHELRSPLARIQVALQIARDRAGPEAHGALDQIERDAVRLGELVGQILAVARLESDPDGLAREPLDLTDVVRQVVDDASFEARGRGRDVRVADAGRVVATGNREVLRRAIENVVRNGLRFTSDGTAVEVSLETIARDGRTIVRIAVRDHGPGVPPDQLGAVLRPFARVDDARSRDGGGTGLGLAITDRAVRAHGGTVRVENAEGGGLRVTLEIPAANGNERTTDRGA